MDTVHLERYRFEFGGFVRSARFYIPADWPVLVDAGPLALILALGDDLGEVFADTTRIWFDPSHPAWDKDHSLRGAVVVYPDPVAVNLEKAQFSSGHTGTDAAYMLPINEIGFIRELLHRIRLLLNQALAERQSVGWNLAADPEVLDADRLYIAGHGAGGVLAYKIASAANPLVHPDDPGFVYAFARIAVYGTTMGGYPRRVLLDAGAAPSAWFPPSSPQVYVSVLHVQGEADEEFASEQAVQLADGNGTLVVVEASKQALLARDPAIDGDAQARVDYDYQTCLERWAFSPGPAVVSSSFSMWIGWGGTAFTSTTTFKPGPTEVTHHHVETLTARVFTFDVVGLLIDHDHGWPKGLEELFLSFFAEEYP